MSNRLTIQFCKFVDYTREGNILDTHWGYRIYDDDEQDYDSGWNSLNQLCDAITPDNIFKFVEENHPNFVFGTLRGIKLNGAWVTNPKEQNGKDE